MSTTVLKLTDIIPDVLKIIVNFVDHKSRVFLFRSCKNFRNICDSLLPDSESFKYLCNDQNYLAITKYFRSLNESSIDDYRRSYVDIRDGLYTAAVIGDKYILKYMIDKGAEGNKMVFYNSAKNGHYDIVKILMEKFPNVPLSHNIQSNDQWDYALYGACAGGHKKIIKLMIENKINTDRIFALGFKHACNGGNISIVNYMIRKGANNWQYGLLGACRGGNLDILKLMIYKGARNFRSGFEKACFHGHIEIVQFLISKGLTIPNMVNGLIFAATSNQKHIIEYLSSLGVVPQYHRINNYRHRFTPDILKLFEEKGFITSVKTN